MNFYINIDFDNSSIYISLCQDSRYYYYQFEKDIKLLINSIEKDCLIYINCGEFYANEIKHDGNQYKYTIIKKNSEIILKKKILNWTTYDAKGIKKIKITDLTKKVEDLKI